MRRTVHANERSAEVDGEEKRKRAARAHVGVSDGMRGGLAATGDSGCTLSGVRRAERRPPGRISRVASMRARKAAQVTHNTPRSNGSRDCGSAGYGWAPVKRRRRPVMEGGVGARFVGSLIDLPRGQRVVAHGDQSRTRVQCDDDLGGRKGTVSSSTAVCPQPACEQANRPRRRRALRSSPARSWCRNSRSSC